jgi:DNA-binding transcriptional LysR family regulator
MIRSPCWDRSLDRSAKKVYREFLQAYACFCQSYLQDCKTMLDWDDLRFALAIARNEGLAGAARALGVDNSTVFRHLNALEEQLGAKVFERLPTGYRPTDSGALLIDAAERMEAEAIAVDRDLTGRDTRLSGRLRVTSSESLAYRILTPEIARFRDAHPGIQVELTIDNRALDLSRREADVALRATRPRESDLFGRKLADILWAVYGAADSTVRTRGKKALGENPFVGWAEAAQGIRAAQWIVENIPHEAIVYRSSSIVNQLGAARAGMGLAVLPCYLGDPEEDLVRLTPPPPELTTELWLITHKDLKGSARIRAFMEVVGEGIRKALPRLVRSANGRGKTAG